MDASSSLCPAIEGLEVPCVHPRSATWTRCTRAAHVIPGHGSRIWLRVVQRLCWGRQIHKITTEKRIYLSVLKVNVCTQLPAASVRVWTAFPHGSPRTQGCPSGHEGRIGRRVCPGPACPRRWLGSHMAVRGDPLGTPRERWPARGCPSDRTSSEAFAIRMKKSPVARSYRAPSERRKEKAASSSEPI